MKRKLLALFLGLSLALSLTPAALAEAGEAVTVTVLATNDIHGVVEAGETAIGLPQVAALKAAADAILVDAGDATQGASFATVGEGADVIAAMNAAGYDAMAAGNHEFDYGVERLRANVAAARFPVLSANATCDGQPLLAASAVVERSGKRIGLIGLTTTATLANANPQGLKGVAFEDEAAALRRELTALAPETDAIVLLCHLGDNAAAVKTTSKALLDSLSDAELAQVTAVVDGHSHTVEDGTPYVRGTKAVPVVQAGTQLANLGQVTLTFTGETVTAAGKVLTAQEAQAADISAPAAQAAKAATEAALAQLTQAQEKVLGEKLLDNQVPVWGGNVYWDYSENRIVETAYGDLVTDAFAQWGREYAQAQDLDLPVIALENGGGIAQPMFQGEVTYGDILGAFNHGNTVEVWRVTPAQLYEALEVGLTMTGQDETGLLLRERVSGSFLQVSGFTYTYDPAGEVGHKVTQVRLGDGVGMESESDVVLDRGDAATPLLLATTNYVAGFAGISQGEKLGELGGEDMAVRDWLMTLTDNGQTPLNYPITANRIRIAGDKSPETYTVSIPVEDENGYPVAGTTVHVNVNGGAYAPAVTDGAGRVQVTVSKGPNAVGLEESGGYVYVNNYSGSGTVTTKTGYCPFAFQVKPVFADVPQGTWYYDAVRAAADAGLMRGVAPGAFQPEGTVTRAMVVQVLWNLAGQPTAASAFPDAVGTWYDQAAGWAAQTGLSAGGGDGAFHGDRAATREEIAVLLYRRAQSPAADAAMGMAGYADGDAISPWAEDAMRWAVQSGVLTGKDGARLDPQGAATRAELAQVLARLSG